MSRLGSFACFLVLFLCLHVSASRSETFTFAVGEWPPFIGSKSPGFGSHAQIVRDAFEKAGHDTRFVFLPWQRSYQMTRNGTYAATFSWSYTDERNQDFYFPERPVGQTTYVHFFKKDRFPDGIGPLSFDDLRKEGLSVVAVRNYWYEDMLEAAGVTVEYVSTEQLAWSMLLHDRADVYMESTEVGMIRKAMFLGDEADLLAHSPTFLEVPMYLMFSRKHPDGRRLLKIWEASSPPAPETLPEAAMR
ncbi:substrate-binding periplasmic protein [Roseibium sp. LAB1]